MFEVGWSVSHCASVPAGNRNYKHQTTNDKLLNMRKRPPTFLFFLLLLAGCLSAGRVMGQTSTTAVVVDDEYERYKKRADDFFREGRYYEARRQYQNCLEVPNFEADAYAKSQIEECTTALTLRQQAGEATQQGRSQEAVARLIQLLNLNPDDVLAKLQLTETYESEGNKLFNQKRYLEAKTNYAEALKYATATKKESLAIQIENTNNLLFPKPPKRTGLKLLTGIVAVGAGTYAFLLQDAYQTKLGTLSRLNQTADPTGSGIINDPETYRQYDDAYTAAEAAQRKNGLFKACLGVAAAATVAELYLLLHRPKPRPRALHWKPASQTWGLAVGYTF